MSFGAYEEGARADGRAHARVVRVPARPLPRAARRGTIEERSARYQRLRRELLEAERSTVLALRNAGAITDEVMHRVERDLDLEDSRLD